VQGEAPSPQALIVNTVAAQVKPLLTDVVISRWWTVEQPEVPMGYEQVLTAPSEQVVLDEAVGELAVAPKVKLPVLTVENPTPGTVLALP